MIRTKLFCDCYGIGINQTPYVKIQCDYPLNGSNIRRHENLDICMDCFKKWKSSFFYNREDDEKEESDLNNYSHDDRGYESSGVHGLRDY